MIQAIAVYPGNNDGCANRMKEHFLRLFVCRAEELPDKLVNLLRSWTVKKPRLTTGAFSLITHAWPMLPDTSGCM
jgi:hypothetical protein